MCQADNGRNLKKEGGDLHALERLGGSGVAADVPKVAEVEGDSGC